MNISRERVKCLLRSFFGRMPTKGHIVVSKLGKPFAIRLMGAISIPSSQTMRLITFVTFLISSIEGNQKRRRLI